MSSAPDGLTLFESALRRYSQMLGLKVNIGMAVKVEAVQRRIMDDVKRLLEGQAEGLEGLSDLLARLSNIGLLRNYIVYVGQELGDEVSPDKIDETLVRAFEGDVNSAGAKSALLAFQAVARAFAESYERSNGILNEVTAYCPICGSESRTMVRTRDGFLMVCHMCGYAWRVSSDKLTCPFCGNANPFSVGLFTDRDRRFGLAYCQECGSTWRVILDEGMASTPRVLLPLLALAAERLRGALPANSEAGEDAKEGSGEGQLGGDVNEPE